ncbi:MAG: DinB family protein [Chloroflexota bacterium]
MNGEIESLSRYLRIKINEALAAGEGLSEVDLNRAPPVPGANSAFVIATHVLGNMRAFVLGIACGREMRRDRPAEFRSRGTHAELRAAGRALSREIETALAGLEAATLDDRFVPAQELYGEGETHEMSRREALLHPLEHAAIHLGRILLTADLLRSPAGAA